MGCGASAVAPKGRRIEGFKANALLTFIERNGGRGKFTTSTTATIAERMIGPQTLHLKSSFLELLRRQGKAEDVLGQASYYVSYSAQAPFLSVVDGIVGFLEQEPRGLGSIVYFDVFCISQHDQAARRKDYFSQEHASLICSIPNVLLVPVPWDNPQTFSRAWILLDLYYCTKFRGRFELALSGTETVKMLEDAAKDPSKVGKFLKQIATTCAIEGGLECQRKDDLGAIMAILNKEIGSNEKIGGMVQTVILEWFERLLKRLIGTPTNRPQGDEVLASKSMLTLGGVYLELGKIDDALTYCESAFDIRKRVLGDGDVSTFGAMERVARIYDAQHKYDKALPLFAACLSKYEKVMGMEHNLTIQSVFAMASMYHAWGKYSDALPLYERCAKVIPKVLAASPYATVPDLKKVEQNIDLLKKLVSGGEGAKRRGSKTGQDGLLSSSGAILPPVAGGADGGNVRRGSKNGIDVVSPEVLGAMMKRGATNGLDLFSAETKGNAILSRRGSKNGLG